MSSFTESAFGRATQRGTAVTETLMIFFPLLTLFLLISGLLRHWEKEHIDPSLAFQTSVVEYNITGPVFFVGSKAMLYLPGTQHYMQDMANAGNNNPSQYNVYVTDMISWLKYRKAMITRGTCTWESYIKLRGQYDGSYESEKVQNWLNEIGREKVSNESLRKKLMTGS